MPNVELSLVPDEVIDPITEVDQQVQSAHPDETEWLLRASSKVINATLQGQPLGEHLTELAEQYKTKGDPENLINEASGIVALVGLYHVRKGTVRARSILEAAPELILSAVSSDTESSDSFSARLADATEDFCVGGADMAGSDGATSIEQVLEPSERISLNYLASLAKQGDAQATHALFAGVEKWTMKIIATKRYFLPGGEWDDLCQEALIGVMEIVETHDPARGSFANLAELVIRRRLWTAIKQANRLKHRSLNGAKSLDEQDETDSGEYDPLVERLPSHRTSVEDEVIAREFLFERVVPRIHNLTKLEHSVLMLIIQGYSYEEIGDMTRENHKTIDNALQRAKRKLGPYKALDKSKS